MKRLSLLVLIVALCVSVCYSQTWATDKVKAHPWDDFVMSAENTMEPDGEGISFTVPSVVVSLISMVAPSMVPDGGCHGETICRWIHYNEHGWVWRCVCLRGNLR